MVVLVTGAAGFIGFHLCLKLPNDNYTVVGIDSQMINMMKLKEERLKIINSHAKEINKELIFFKIDITQAKEVRKVFDRYKPTKVVNLAAQAGVRYSLVNPTSYYNSNLIGFGNIIENCNKYGINHLVYASSSSVYGGNIKLPLSEKDSVDHPKFICSYKKSE